MPGTGQRPNIYFLLKITISQLSDIYFIQFPPSHVKTNFGVFFTTKILTSDQDGGIGRYTAFSNNQKKDNNKYKNKKQAELPENQTVWKSENQGGKEKTFIQTSRRGRDGQLGQRGLATRWQLEDLGRTVAGGPGSPTFP